MLFFLFSRCTTKVLLWVTRTATNDSMFNPSTLYCLRSIDYVTMCDANVEAFLETMRVEAS